MMFRKPDLTVFLVAILLLASGSFSLLYAQEQDQDYRRVSLSVSGGATFANEEGFSLLESRFNVLTETSGVLRVGIQYAITPAWSLEGGYSYTEIRGTGGSFTTNMNNITLKNIFNLNQLLFINRISNSVNPYITAGIGYDMYDYESSTESVSNNNLSYNLGVGLAFKASQTIDLFTHYEYNIASNRVDNRLGNGNGFGADVLTNLTGGIRINFGKKGTTHPSWRPVPVDVSPENYKELVSKKKQAEDLQQKVSELEKLLEEQNRKHANEIATYTELIDSLEQKIANLENQLQTTKDSLATVVKEATENDTLDKTISAGHYVQVFATIGLNSAKDIMSRTISELKNYQRYNQNELVFIAKRKQYYEVLIGKFDEFQNANEVLEIMNKIYDDAFVITFPRPLSLQELYEDIEVIND